MFLVNLERKLEVFEYTNEVLKEDLEFFGVKSAHDLNDYDFKVFDTEKKANSWLKKYKKVLNGLDNKKICKSRDLPAILYKRRYIVQTLMKEKLQTVRHYKKDWKKGDLFNLHDQTYFLTVKLTKLTDLGNGLYQYDFKLL